VNGNDAPPFAAEEHPLDLTAAAPAFAFDASAPPPAPRRRDGRDAR